MQLSSWKDFTKRFVFCALIFDREIRLVGNLAGPSNQFDHVVFLLAFTFNLMIIQINLMIVLNITEIIKKLLIYRNFAKFALITGV